MEEKDGSYSAIRLFDLILTKTIPVPADRQIRFQALAKIRAESMNEPAHKIQFLMLSPLGEEQPIGDEIVITYASTFPDLIAGGGVARLDISMQPQHEGTYWLKLFIDGEETARVPLTILRADREPLAQ
jgi:hypothetical protein